jgi:DNA-binding MarR family transcriptional regulator/N-acetylglutamate synthase-like GNAT family acetyltransferase
MDHVAVLRRFNRSFTARIGVLEDRFLGLDRPLGHARVLFEIGRADVPVGVRDLRTGLDLDSGYLSRILRALEGDGLIDVITDPTDARQRQVRVTAEGRAEWRRLDERSDRLAARVVDGLAPRHRERLSAALHEADRLLTAAHARLVVTDPRAGDAREAVRRYVAELDERFPGGFDADMEVDAELDALTPPAGRFVLAQVDGRAVGCGGVQVLADGAAEIKRMWVSTQVRGTGLGGRLLRALEAHASDLGCVVVRLDTNSVLTAAVAMYERAGYRPIPRYNTNPYPDLFFEKRLANS